MPEVRLVKAAEITVLVHATEDEEKVKQAIKRVVPYEQVFESQRLSGHYADPIILLTSRTSQKKEATDLFIKILNKLSSIERQALLDDLQNHVDPRGNLYLRLDKQKAFNGKNALNDNDPIRIKLKFQLPHKADPVITIKEYILNIEEDESQ